MSDTAHASYEHFATQFERETGYIAPGKSVPEAMASESYERERYEVWTEWRKARAGALALSSPLQGEARPDAPTLDLDAMYSRAAAAWTDAGNGPSLPVAFAAFTDIAALVVEVRRLRAALSGRVQRDAEPATCEGEPLWCGRCQRCLPSARNLSAVPRAASADTVGSGDTPTGETP